VGADSTRALILTGAPRRVGEESIGTFRVPLSVSAVSSFVPV
jgi:hypothetical protein